MRAHAGDVFIVFFDVQRVGIEPRLLHHSLRQRLRLHHVEFKIVHNLGQQALLGIAEAGAVFGYQADIVGVADFEGE